ncbi:DUF2463 domain-containing protein [Encephalitozoon cuniculi]|nr:DUF2463 domain-containing protein [Encephalitozoon cuniculi]UYI27763.1 DUF2463 domain-containing protein [Encephalitozoon cuniculi]UYI27993.1 DUF2463 domain-containing protein [Encephalitozoon cuniculi]UYI28160.1 DUF2463 domain-containing protein [Encephalitozoon cuniculi]
MSITSIPQPHETNEQHHTEIQHHRSAILNNDLVVLISIAFPALLYFIFDKDNFEKNPCLRLITTLFPLSYLAAQHLLLFHTSWKGNNKPEDTLHKALRYFFSALFITFATIFILSIIILTNDNWSKDDDPLFFSIVLPSFFIPPTYLLSISCSLVPGQTGFTDTGINILIDVLILLCFIVNFIFMHEKSKYRLYSAVTFPLLVLVRLLTEKYYPSGKSSLPTTTWRVVAFVLIFILVIYTYTDMGCEAILTLDYYFTYLTR